MHSLIAGTRLAAGCPRGHAHCQTVVDFFRCARRPGLRVLLPTVQRDRSHLRQCSRRSPFRDPCSLTSVTWPECATSCTLSWCGAQRARQAAIARDPRPAAAGIPRQRSAQVRTLECSKSIKCLPSQLTLSPAVVSDTVELPLPPNGCQVSATKPQTELSTGLPMPMAMAQVARHGTSG